MTPSVVDQPLSKAAAAPNRRAATFSGRPRPAQLNHLFVSNARFWCMLSIIAVHASSAFDMVKGLQPQVSLAAVAFVKFGTIGFFLISGFLLGERVDRRDPFDYFGRRLKRVFLPWLVWITMLCAVSLANKFHQIGADQPVSVVLQTGYATFVSSVLNSAFWFVPNLLVCILILLAFRRYIYNWKLGALLLAANLVYVVNIYALWFPSRHNKALFAYVFYLWLGSYVAHHFQRFTEYLARISTPALVALATITALLSYGESAFLAAINNPEPLNTLRASNQLFSIAMVLVFYKFTRPTWPRFIDVRRHTFGLYLSHTIVMLVFAHFTKSVPYYHPQSHFVADLAGVATWIAFSAAVYLICLAITAWIANRPSVQWTIGLSAQDPPHRLPPETVGPHALARTW